MECYDVTDHTAFFFPLMNVVFLSRDLCLCAVIAIGFQDQPLYCCRMSDNLVFDNGHVNDRVNCRSNRCTVTCHRLRVQTGDGGGGGGAGEAPDGPAADAPVQVPRGGDRSSITLAQATPRTV